VKKGCIYILAVFFLFNATAFDQVFKLPVLIAHYLEHRQQDERIGFLDFLSMHYWGKDLNDNDQDRDNQLPFKSVGNLAAFQPAIPVTRPLLEKHEPYVVRVHQPLFRENNLANPTLSSLFRPPRS
jgi:hypothetical protein